MARVKDYDKKIEAIKSKIEKKTEELKKLKAEVAKLEEAKVKLDFKTLNEYLANKGIAPEDALNKLKEAFGE